jgi:S1-C subfamily serine protease
VPGRIDRCRCGHGRGADATAPPPAAGAPTPDRRARGVVEGGLLALIIVASGYYYTSARTTPVPSRTAASARLDMHAATPRLASRDTIASTSAQAAAEHAAPEPSAPAASLDKPEPSATPLEDLIEHAMPGVVLIEAEKTRGSGFLARPDVVVTNAHVIAGATSVTITLQGGTRVAGTVFESSDDLDLSLVSIPRVALADVPLPLGSASALRLGQGIVALGWAQDLQQSPVTRGIVTGLRRDGNQRLVQTDAVPNHGDSGGPLIDRRGEVVGVTTFRAEVSGTTAGFAVSIDDVKALLARSGR